VILLSTKSVSAKDLVREAKRIILRISREGDNPSDDLIQDILNLVDKIKSYDIHRIESMDRAEVAREFRYIAELRYLYEYIYEYVERYFRSICMKSSRC